MTQPPQLSRQTQKILLLIIGLLLVVLVGVLLRSIFAMINGQPFEPLPLSTPIPTMMPTATIEAVGSAIRGFLSI